MIPHSRPTMGEEEMAAVAGVLASGRLAQGPEVEAFEVECAALVGRKHAVAVSSGTAAMHVALLALGGGGDLRSAEVARSGDRPQRVTVAMPSYACAALWQAAGWCGAQAVLCDSAAGFNADVTEAGGDLAVAVHLFGEPAPADGVAIEDIAQSIGGRTGKQGRIAVASFYATKLLTTGEGGMLLTDDAALAEEARDLRDYDNRDDAKRRFAYKMTEMQAAMGRVQLRRLPGFVARRRELAERYAASLHGLPASLPRAEGHVYFRYVIRTPLRAELETALHAAGIEAKRPVHAPAHHALGGEMPLADRAHAEALSLPIYPLLSDSECDTIAAAVRHFYESAS